MEKSLTPHLKGQLTVEVEGEVFVLEEGHLDFDFSKRSHITANHTAQPTLYLHACTMEFFDGVEMATDLTCRNSR